MCTRRSFEKPEPVNRISDGPIPDADNSVPGTAPDFRNVPGEQIAWVIPGNKPR